MSDTPVTPPVPEHDRLLQATCLAIVTVAAKCVDAEPAGTAMGLKVPSGEIVGKQITIDAGEPKGPLNTCRLAVLNAEISPGAEVARIEYGHDKETKHGMQRVYSIQSVRQRGGELVLLENFLAESSATVREADFRPIESEKYAQEVVLKTLQEWAQYRAWQLQQAKH